MSCIVFGWGRSGSHLLLELIRSSGQFQASKKIYDRKIFDSPRELPEKYLTKIDHTFVNFPALESLVELNPHLKFVWSVRDPRDMILSKLYRGRIGEERSVPAADGEYHTVIPDLMIAYNLYSACRNHWPDKTIFTRMEDVILNTRDIAENLCRFLDVKYSSQMLDFCKNMRDEINYKRDYNAKLEKSRIGIWQKWGYVYDCFFHEARL